MHFIEIAFTDNSKVEVVCCLRENRVDYFQSFNSIYALFIALLYKTDWADAPVVDEKWHNWVFNVIEQIYFTNGAIQSSLSPQQRFMLHQQVHGNLVKYSVTKSKDILAGSIYNELRNENQYDGPTDTYEGLLEGVQKYHIRVPDADYYGFDTAYDFNMWVFQQIIDSRQPVKKCAYCGKYFFNKYSNSKFCSRTCKQESSNASQYCGFSDLATTVKNISDIFRRKIDSEHEFCLKSVELPDTYDAEEIFRVAKLSSKKILQRTDFKKLQQAFSSLNIQRSESLTCKWNEYSQRTLSEKELLEEKEKYLSWLQCVHKQMKAFSFNERELSKHIGNE